MSAYEPATIVNEDSENKQKTKPQPQFSSLYMVTHMIISFFAIYLSWRCNNGFKLLPFLAALLCPYLYIIWALATKGGCGVFENLSSNLSPTSLSPVRSISF
jgi:hypothetical protein